MSIAEDLLKIKEDLPENVRLVAVSKTKPIEAILEAYNAGHTLFGENKVQDLANKYRALPKDIEWHFIGHLQSNKVKYLAGFVNLLHGVDSLKILSVINKEARKAERVINCLLQMKIAQEESKFGFSETEVDKLLMSSEYKQMENIRITGVMGMATYTSDMDRVRKEFRKLSTIFKYLQQRHFNANPEFREISMGMSHDYTIAVDEGATLVRIGSSIFGERTY